MGKKIVHVEFPAKDADRAESFWEGFAGWTIGDAGMEGFDYRMFQEDGWGGAVYPQQEGEQGPIVYFDSEDIDADLAKVRELGGKAEEKQPIPHVGWFARCKDRRAIPSACSSRTSRSRRRRHRRHRLAERSNARTAAAVRASAKIATTARLSAVGGGAVQRVQAPSPSVAPSASPERVDTRRFGRFGHPLRSDLTPSKVVAHNNPASGGRLKPGKGAPA